MEFKIKDAQGVVQLDLTRSTTKFLGELVVSASGSTYVPELFGRRGWVVFVADGWAGLSMWAGRAWVEGPTINYQLTRGTYRLRYGVY